MTGASGSGHRPSVRWPRRPGGIVPLHVPLSYDEFRATRYFPGLDGLRAVSIALVVVFHVRGNPLEVLRGANGVRLFFVISGFIITTLSLREETRDGELDRRGFLVRRAARILPLYYLALVAYVVAVFVFDLDDRERAFREALPYYLTYLQELPVSEQANRPFAISWSLGIEEKFYLVWPFLAFWALRRSRLRVAVAAASALALGTAWPWLPLGEYVRHYADILVGAVVAFVLHERGGYERLAVLGRSWPRRAAIVGLAATFVGQPSLPDGLFLLLPILAGAVIVASVASPARAAPVLTWSPVVTLGRISYGVYLFHQLGLAVAERLVPERFGTAGDLATLAIAMVATLPLCLALHRFVERPLIAAGRRYSAARRGAVSAGPLGDAGDPGVPVAPTDSS